MPAGEFNRPFAFGYPRRKHFPMPLSTRAAACITVGPRFPIKLAPMTTYSLLDLCPVTEDGTVSSALEQAVELARHAEKLGYHRFWLAEHHNMPGIASAATAVAIGHVAAGTDSIRVGAGGIMLPNHAPLVIAEQFGTLEALYPGRIDLGLGRAPGTDQTTAYALRRNLHADVNQVPTDVQELLAYFDDPDPAQKVHAIPGEGLHVPIWILGSSTFGARLAAALGLPYAFAAHFAPAELTSALAAYRRNFQPSRYCSEPKVMLGITVMAAESDDEAHLLASSMQQTFVSLRSGRPGRLKPPVEGYYRSLGSSDRAILDSVMACAAIGSPETVERKLRSLLEQHQPDELMITGTIYDQSARLTSFRIAAEAMQRINGN